MTEVEKSRSGRIVKRKVFADFQQLDDDLKSITTEELRESASESKKLRLGPTRRSCRNIPTNYEELKAKTDAGIIPETVYYRASNNSMYIPSITADMLKNDGNDLTVQTRSDKYFKYNRVRQSTKIDYAEPEKVYDIIYAVRKRPILWDQRLICHRNSNLSRRAWDQLDLELGIDEEYPLARRKQIWKSKRDYFVSAVNAANLRKWIYADALEFYRPMINFRTTFCLRPTVAQPSQSVHDKLVLADKNIQCTPGDKKNVLT